MRTPDFYSEHVVKGRRAYACTFCRKPIAKGERHVAVAGCSCGEFYGHRAHVDCEAVASGRPPMEEAAPV